MAIPQGAFTVPASNVSSVGTGCYVYTPSISQPQYYAGSFLIDTGIDDPTGWVRGVSCAEVYGARVYGTSGSASPSQTTGNYACEWNIAATPVWRMRHNFGNTGIVQQRVLILCDVYVTNPTSVSAGAWYRLDAVDWTLYRI